MTQLNALINRNIKLYFKDKGLFFTSLITPAILLVLYVTFLSNVYESSFRGGLESVGASVPDKLLNGFVGGQLASSLLAVCCVTVAFCSNMLMVQDRVSGARHDLTMSPVSGGVLAMSYYLANLCSTLLVCFGALGLCLIYLLRVGWYLNVSDVALLALDVLLLSLFGSVLSGAINSLLSTQGQISAVGTIVSAGYGFLCGAYMPISQFSEGLQNILSLLPGTYGTSLLRNHVMDGVFREMKGLHFPDEAVEGLRDSVDCNIYSFGDKVAPETKYLVLGGTILILMLAYVLINALRDRRKK